VEPIFCVTASLRISQFEARTLYPQQFISRPRLKKLIGKVGEVRKAALENFQVRRGNSRGLLVPCRVWTFDTPSLLELAK
jgi:hypothetical protein